MTDYCSWTIYTYHIHYYRFRVRLIYQIWRQRFAPSRVYNCLLINNILWRSYWYIYVFLSTLHENIRTYALCLISFKFSLTTFTSEIQTGLTFVSSDVIQLFLAHSWNVYVLFVLCNKNTWPHNKKVSHYR